MSYVYVCGAGLAIVLGGAFIFLLLCIANRGGQPETPVIRRPAKASSPGSGPAKASSPGSEPAKASSPKEGQDERS
jgi:hypothetical protein